jgi:hypothetical protein
MKSLGSFISWDMSGFFLPQSLFFLGGRAGEEKFQAPVLRSYAFRRARYNGYNSLSAEGLQSRIFLGLPQNAVFFF